MNDRMKQLIGKVMAEDIPFKIDVIGVTPRIQSIYENNCFYNWAFTDTTCAIREDCYPLQDISDEKLLKCIAEIENKN